MSEQFLRGKKALLVEDNELNQEIARTVLEEAGLIIDTADDGTEAVGVVRTVQAGTYDLVLMDIQMPVMDGYEAVRAIRVLDDPAKARVPIVAITANAFEEDRQRAFDAGMDSHVPKPLDDSGRRKLNRPAAAPLGLSGGGGCICTALPPLEIFH